MYIQPNGPNGLFRQPGGPGTQVFPAPATGVDYFSTAPFSELSGLQFPGCGHSLDYPTLQNEYDEDTGEQVVLVICSECSFIQYATTPENAYSTVFNPQVII